MNRSSVRTISISVSKFSFILIHAHDYYFNNINFILPFIKSSSMQKLIKLSSSMPKGLSIRNGLSGHILNNVNSQLTKPPHFQSQIVTPGNLLVGSQCFCISINSYNNFSIISL